MVFRSKVDAFFITIILFAIFIIAATMFIPLYFEGGDILTVALILLLITSFILWCSFWVKYVFQPDYLFVKGGPFRSQISYDHITKVSPTAEILVGYKLLSSKDAIEIFYKTAALGSVKISPKDKEGFIMELKKRCPNLEIYEGEF